MKKQNLKHPKLYFNYKIKNSQVKLYYYSNQLDSKGKRLSKSNFFNLSSFSEKELIELNKEEYKNLLIYISRQEKVLNNYLKKGLKEQYDIVQESLYLMYDFKKKFNQLFINLNGEI